MLTGVACPAGWDLHGSRCFKVDATDRTGAQAKTYCTSQGGALASLHSLAEHNFVFGLMNAETDAWIGIENVNSWSDGTTWAYTKFADGEPNNAGGIQDCGYVRKKAGSTKNNGWLDMDCTSTMAQTICAREGLIDSTHI